MGEISRACRSCELTLPGGFSTLAQFTPARLLGRPGLLPRQLGLPEAELHAKCPERLQESMSPAVASLPPSLRIPVPQFHPLLGRGGKRTWLPGIATRGEVGMPPKMVSSGFPQKPAEAPCGLLDTLQSPRLSSLSAIWSPMYKSGATRKNWRRPQVTPCEAQPPAHQPWGFHLQNEIAAVPTWPNCPGIKGLLHTHFNTSTSLFPRIYNSILAALMQEVI